MSRTATATWFERLEERCLLSASDLFTQVDALYEVEEGQPLPEVNDVMEDPNSAQLGPRWSSTATNGGGLIQGAPTTLTWSIARDGTSIAGFNGEAASNSSFVSFLDTIRGAGPGGSDLTQRPWFSLFNDSFQRFSQIAGLTFVYEPNDDSSTFANPAGALGVRGDIRIGGHLIDGASNVLAYAFFPQVGDMVFDTGDSTFFGDAASNNRRFRNTLMHELGHSLGISHVVSDDANFLMEPFLTISFDGPQFDDILATQRQYGDVREKSGGNDTLATATSLGTVASGATATIGTLGDATAVLATQTDFLSIDDETDIDFLSFEATGTGTATITLTPRGPTYLQGPQGGTQTTFNAAAQSDLTLTVLNSAGAVLQTVNAGGLGATEVISNLALPSQGTYFVRVTGATTDVIQFYGVAINVVTNNDSTAPTADIVNISPDPRNTAVGIVTVDFSEPVSGVDIADFSLTRDSQAVSLAGLSVTQVTSSRYTLNLSSVAATSGSYVLTLNASGSGIRDTSPNLNALAVDASDAFVIDLVAPTVDIEDVAPDPRNSNAGAVTVNFSENVSNVDITDFTLTRNGSPVSLSGVTITTAGASQYALNLGGVTGTVGTYVLTLNAATSGIRDAASNALAGNVTDSWTVETTAPTASLVAIAPDPRNTAVGLVTINFSEPVQNVDITDFSLTRGGVAVNLVGVPVVAVTASQYTVDLSSVTSTAGSYIFQVRAVGAGITDLAGNALTASVSDSFIVETTQPTSDILDVTPDPRRTTVGVVTVNFSEAVQNVDITDFTLTRGGVSVPLTGLLVTAVLATQFTVNLSTVTGVEGAYVLTLLSTSNITDLAGNGLLADTTDVFSVDLTLPTGDIVDVLPDPRVTNAGIVTINFTEPVSGVGASDFTLTRNGSQASLVGAVLTTVSPSQYTLDLTTFTVLDGLYVLTLVAGTSGIQDLAGNVLTANATDSFRVDLSLPTADIVDVIPDPRRVNAGSVTVNFSKDVTGVDLADFRLTRDSVDVPLTGLPLNLVTASQYTLDLSSVTETSGSYVLRLVALNSGIQDVLLNTLTTDATDAFVVDKIAPTGAFVPVNPDPRNTSAGIVTLNFSEPVTGLSLSDLSLMRNGSTISLTGLTLNQVTTQQFTINLTTVTAQTGDYVLSIPAIASGVQDSAGNVLAADISEDWKVDTAAPTATFIAVTPDPRNSNAGVVTVNFSEPVTGVSLADFSLARNGVAVSLAGLTVNAITASQYSIDLSSVSTEAGAYVLALVASGSQILDLSGNPLTTNASDSFVVETTAPTATIVAVLPDPRGISVGTVTINFSEAVAGVDVTDFTLTRDGAAVSITGLTLNSVSASQYTLNLATVSNTSGTYVFTLVASTAGITDLAGNALANNASETVTVDASAPTASFVVVSPDPRTTNAGTVTLDFNENVTGVSLSDFTLTRDGAVVNLTGTTLTAVTARQYTLNLASLTATSGAYVLTLVATNSGIQDALGNVLTTNATESFVVDSTAPTADIVDITPDPRNTPVGIVTINLSEAVTGVDLADFTLTQGGNAVSLTGLTLTTVSPTQYTLDLSTVTTSSGAYVLTLNASTSGIQDTIGNVIAVNASDAFTLDMTVPTVDIVNITPDPRNSPVGTVTITFSEAVAGVDIADFGLTLDGITVGLSALTVTPISGAQYSLNLTSVTGASGSYVLTLNALNSGIADLAGNVLTTGATDEWLTDSTAPVADIVDVAPDPRATNAGIVTIDFTKDVSGVNLADFSLTRNGSAVSLSGLSVTQVTARRYTLDLTTLTQVAGSYVLTLTAAGSGILDTANNALASNATDSFSVDPVAPNVDIVDVTPDPRYSLVGTVTMTFNEAVSGVSTSDFTLTRNGSAVDLSALTLTTINALQYSLDLTSVTGLNGTYVLTLVASGSGIADLAGNALALNASDNFSIDINDAPIFTSASTVNLAENKTDVLTATATDADLPAQTLSFSFAGGADQSKFTIDAKTGKVSFIAGPNFEAASDANADNVFEVTLRAIDGFGGQADQLLRVTITDAAESLIVAPADWPTDGKVTLQRIGTQLHALSAIGLNVVPPHAFANVTTIDVDGRPAANDVLTINGTGGDPIPTNGLDFNGGSGLDSLINQNANSDWTLNGTDSGTVGPTPIGGGLTASNVITFSNVENVTGGTGIDRFVLQTGSLSGSLSDLDGATSVTKTGTGAFTSAGINSFTGSTAVSAGTLLINGTHAGDVTVANGAGLGGSGIVSGSVTVNGVLAVAETASGPSIGTLTTGPISFVDAPQSSLLLDLGGPGASADQLIANGVTIAPATKLIVRVATGNLGPAGVPVVIINNTSNLPINGSFANKGEGATFSILGQQAKISYVGGTGNDLTLTFSGELDFGDAPDTGVGTSKGNYRTTFADNGPSHVINGPKLGALVDRDADGQPNATATGDDLAVSDDEDSLVSVTSMVAGGSAQMVVTVSGGPAKLDGWIDFNANGEFEAFERITVTGGSSVVTGSNTIRFNVPTTAVAGASFLRLRVSTAGGLDAVGPAADGEVEDHAVTIAANFAAVLVDDNFIGLAPGAAASSGIIGVTRFATIQQGVNAVSAGGTVSVNAGTYPEAVVITKNVTVDGTGTPGQIIVDPVSGNGFSINPAATSVTLSDLTVQGALHGVQATSGALTLSLVQLINNSGDGLNLQGVGNVTLNSVTATGNAANGLLALGSGDLTLNAGQFSGINIGNANSVTLGTSVITSTKAVQISALNALRLNVPLNVGANTVTLLANQDGVGAEGFLQASSANITTTNDTAAAVDITVNTLVGGTGALSLGSIATGLTGGLTGGRVTLSANMGAITDSNLTLNNVMSGNVVLTALGGVGSATDPIESTVTRMEGASGTGGYFLTNTGALSVGGISSTIGVSATTGKIEIRTASPLTIEESVVSGGSILLRAGEATTAGDDLTVNNGVTIQSTTSTVTLQAGDNITLQAGSVVESTTSSISIASDHGNLDAGVGTLVRLSGRLSAAAGTTVTGGTDNDTFSITYVAGELNVGTVTIADLGGLADAVVVNGTSGDDKLFFTSTNPPTATTNDQVTRGTASAEPIIVPNTIESLSINGGDGSDTFRVQPSQLFPVTINGQNPSFGAAGVPPGDTLEFDALGNSLSVSGTTIFVAGGTPAFKGVTYRNLETLPFDFPFDNEVLRFDFNALTNSTSTPVTQTQSKTQTGYVGVSPNDVFNPTLGYGWNQTMSAYLNRTLVTSTAADLINDGHFFTAPTSGATRTFSSIVNGTQLMATIVFGTAGEALDGIEITNADTGAILATNLGTTLGKWAHLTVPVTVTDGTLDLRFEDKIGNNRRFSISALDVRPLNLNSMGFTVTGALDANGTSIDTFTLTGGPANGLVTVSPTLGTVVSPDADLNFDGLQVATNASGQATIRIQRPFAVGNSTVLLTTPTGEKQGAVIVDYASLSPKNFDFNTNSSATFSPLSPTNPGGYVGVKPGDIFDNSRGYGWLNPVQSFANSTFFGNQVALTSDSHRGNAPGTFRVNLDDGNYDVHLYMGDASDHAAVSVVANGLTFVNRRAIAKNAIIDPTFTVAITNGVLDLTFSQQDTFFSDPHWVVNGLEIRPSTMDPTVVITPNNVGNVPANGTTITTVTASSTLPTGAEITVSASVGTITSTDTNPAIAGLQVAVGNAGLISFTIQSPFFPATPTVEFRAVDGSVTTTVTDTAFLNFIDATPQPTNVRKFDFNRGQDDATMSPTAPGFIGVRTNHRTPLTTGYGWANEVNSFNSSISPAFVTPGELYRDGASGSFTGTFQVTAQAGLTYALTIYVGRFGTAIDFVSIAAEGAAVVIAPATSSEQFTTVLISGARDANNDGLLSIGFSDVGGNRNGWAVNGVEVAANLALIDEAFIASANDTDLPE